MAGPHDGRTRLPEEPPRRRGGRGSLFEPDFGRFGHVTVCEFLILTHVKRLKRIGVVHGIVRRIYAQNLHSVGAFAHVERRQQVVVEPEDDECRRVGRGERGELIPDAVYVVELFSVYGECREPVVVHLHQFEIVARGQVERRQRAVVGVQRGEFRATREVERIERAVRLDIAFGEGCASAEVDFAQVVRVAPEDAEACAALDVERRQGVRLAFQFGEGRAAVHSERFHAVVVAPHRRQAGMAAQIERPDAAARSPEYL